MSDNQGVSSQKADEGNKNQGTQQPDGKSGGEQKKDVDFIPKSQYEELNGKYARIEKLNQDLIAEREAEKQRLNDALSKLEQFETSQKSNKIKGVKTPEEIQALIDEEIGAVKSQFQSKLDEVTGTLTAKELRLKELEVVSKVQELAGTQIKKDMFPYLKADALRELQVDPSNPDKIIVVINGKKELSKDTPGEAMELAEWIKLKKVSHPSMFEPSGIHTGTLNGQPTKTASKPASKAEWLKIREQYPRAERIKLDKEFGF